MALAREGKGFKILCNGKEEFGFCSKSEKTIVLLEGLKAGERK